MGGTAYGMGQRHVRMYFVYVNRQLSVPNVLVTANTQRKGEGCGWHGQQISLLSRYRGMVGLEIETHPQTLWPQHQQREHPWRTKNKTPTTRTRT